MIGGMKIADMRERLGFQESQKLQDAMMRDDVIFGANLVAQVHHQRLIARVPERSHAGSMR
jgi:hypothetical protein